MELDVFPPVDAQVRQALLAALEEVALLSSRPPGYETSWRRAGLTDGVEGPDEAEPPRSYALSPRSTRGATRA